MDPVAGMCRHCGSRLGFIRNLVTGRLTALTACPHCDGAHPRPCQACAQMEHPVRLIKRDEGTADG